MVINADEDWDRLRLWCGWCEEAEGDGEAGEVGVGILKVKTSVDRAWCRKC